MQIFFIWKQLIFLFTLQLFFIKSSLWLCMLRLGSFSLPCIQALLTSYHVKTTTSVPYLLWKCKIKSLGCRQSQSYGRKASFSELLLFLGIPQFSPWAHLESQGSSSEADQNWHSRIRAKLNLNNSLQRGLGIQLFLTSLYSLNHAAVSRG